MRAVPSVWSRDSTVHGPAISEKCSPPMRRPSISSSARSERSCAEASLYGLRIGTTWSTPGAPSRPRRGDVLAVADRADHGDLLPARRMGPGADLLDAVDDGLDLVLGRRRLHHDHHLVLLELYATGRRLRTDGRSARPARTARFVHGRAPREIARRNGIAAPAQEYAAMR